MDQPPRSNSNGVAPLIVCPRCKLELFLVGTETEHPGRDLYTFECPKCHELQIRGIAVP